MSTRRSRKGGPPRGKRKDPARQLEKAVRLHRKGALDDARDLYQKILRDDPNNPNALHLLGLLCLAQGDSKSAESWISKAIALDSRPAEFHNSLGVVLLGRAHNEEARVAFAAALERNPVDAEALNNMGNALQNLGRFDDAVLYYERAVQARENYEEAHYNMGRVLQFLRRGQAALAAFRRAVEIRPDYLKAQRATGGVLLGLGDLAGAEAAYRAAIDIQSGDAESHAALAELLERKSALDDALAVAEIALRHDAGNVRAALAGARCERRLGRFREGLARLDGLDLGSTGVEPESHVRLEQAALQDRLGDFASAYDLYARANALALQTPRALAVDTTACQRLIQGLEDRFDKEWVDGWTPTPDPVRPSPVFMLGFPRSGTTLLEQVLDAHPALTTMEEKDPVEMLRGRITALPGSYPAALASLAPETVEELRAAYFSRAVQHLGGETKGMLVDKMPLNTIDAGLIFRLFPDARFILSLRHPCDVVLSGFMQLFEPNEAMIQLHTLEGAAEFYASVMGLWQHYAALLPLQVAAVRYEDLVTDFEGETRRLLDFLGLEWDEAMRDHAKRVRQRPVSTPSYHQVMQPLYSRSIGRWHNYRFAFDKLMPTLQPFIQAWAYTE